MSRPPGTVPSTPSGVLEPVLRDVAVDDYGDSPEVAGPLVIWPRRPSTWLALLVAVVVGVVIAGALLNTRLSTASRQETREALGDRVAAVSDAVAGRQDAVADQSTAVQALQDRLLAGSAAGPVRSAAIDGLSDPSATTPLTGPGVIVSVDDAPDAAAGSLNRVLDRDLQDIVNALWRAGADGIAINDQRLTAASAIRAAGEAILVNYQPLTPPYIVSAVGEVDVNSGESDLRGLLSRLSEDYGLVTDLRADQLALPAGELRSPRYASTEVTNVTTP